MDQSLPKTYDGLAEAYLSLQDRMEYLEELVRLLQRGRFAASSEKITHPGMKPLFADIEEESEEEADEPDDSQKSSKPRATRKRRPLSKALPREEVFCDLSDEDKKCPCCQEDMKQVTSKFSEKLHITRPKAIVKKFVTPVYACKSCEEAKQAPMPAHPLPGCGVTIETLAYIIANKYLDGLPYYRQEQNFKRMELPITRDKMSRWTISLASRLKGVKEKLHQDLIRGGYLGMDETSLQVLKEKGRRADQKSHMIVQAREGPIGQKITIFHYEKSKAAIVMKEHLRGFDGSLVTDGLMVYQTYVRSVNSISHGGCWAHARRKFAEAVKGKKVRSETPKKAILLIKELFDIEDSLKLEGFETTKRVRGKKSKAIIEEIEAFLNEELLRVPKKSLTGKALHYLNNNWRQLTRFLDDPKLPIHNNYVERQIKPFVIGRKAWMFSDTPDGADASATFYTLINTAKENGLDPHEYLVSVLTALAKNEELPLPYSRQSAPTV